MALKNSKKVETNRYELEISIDAAAFEKAVEKAYRQNVKSINVPGFRKGKAPRKMIEKMYGEGVFYEDALNILYPDGRTNEIGDLYITATEMIFVKKSKGARLAFGFIGTALEKGEEKLRFTLSDIISGGRTKIGLNSNVYQITLRSGETYKICVNNPAKIACLEQRFGR